MTRFIKIPLKTFYNGDTTESIIINIAEIAIIEDKSFISTTGTDHYSIVTLIKRSADSNKSIVSSMSSQDIFNQIRTK